MGRTLPGQLINQHAQPGDKRTSHLVGEVRPPTAKVQGMLGILGAVQGGFLVKAMCPPQRTAMEAISCQPVPAALCAYRTSGLMISRPGGRGYKARILSHNARSQGSITASGLQGGDSHSSTAVTLSPSFQAPEMPHQQNTLLPQKRNAAVPRTTVFFAVLVGLMLPLHLDNAGPALGHHLCCPFAAQAVTPCSSARPWHMLGVTGHPSKGNQSSPGTGEV